MREILFRGRRTSDRKWVYGGVFFGGGTISIIYECVPPITKYKVFTKTVGQFTGWFDKNGKKIFEGDIIQNVTEGKTAVVQWFSEHSAFMLWCKSENQVYWLYDNDFHNIEVIGNIYDNPELLGGADDA